MPVDARLQIPEEFIPGLVSLLRLSDEAASALEAALHAEKPRLFRREFILIVAEKLPLDRADAIKVVETLLTLYVVRASWDTSIDEFVEEIITASKSLGDDRLQLTDDEWNATRLRLARLLGEPSVRITSKAFDVMSEHERTYATKMARILTDVRPIFGDDASQALGAAVIIHNLKIGYHEQDELKEFYIALDSRDLKDLSEVIARALEKEQNIIRLLKEKTDIEPLIVERERG